MTDFDKTLTQLEGDDWGKPPAHSTHLVQNIHRIRHVPLKKLTIEDLGQLIRQEFSLNHSVPLALERLQKNPLVEGEEYGHSLLSAVLSIQPAFWINRPKPYQILVKIVKRARVQMDKEEGQSYKKECDEFLRSIGDSKLKAIKRVPSPNKEYEALLVRGKSGDGDDVYRVYVVAAGESFEGEKHLFSADQAEGISLSWKNRRTIEVSFKIARVLAREKGRFGVFALELKGSIRAGSNAGY